MGVGLIFALFIRSDVDMTVAPVRNPTFVTMSDGSIRNAYEVRLRNKHGEDRPFRLSVKGEDASIRLQLEGTPYETVDVPADSTKLQRVYLIAPPSSDAAEDERTEVRLWVEDIANGERAYEDTFFNGRSN